MINSHAPIYRSFIIEDKAAPLIRYRHLKLCADFLSLPRDPHKTVITLNEEGQLSFYTRKETPPSKLTLATQFLATVIKVALWATIVLPLLAALGAFIFVKSNPMHNPSTSAAPPPANVPVSSPTPSTSIMPDLAAKYTPYPSTIRLFDEGGRERFVDSSKVEKLLALLKQKYTTPSDLAWLDDFEREHKNAVSQLLRERIDSKPVLVPNNAALKWLAKKYHQKYGITLHVTSQEELEALIKQLQAECSEDLYVGVIVNKSRTSEEHVTPMLLHLTKNRSGEINIECVVMDVDPGNIYGRSVLDRLNVPHTFHVGNLRQADSYSCRTGAVHLLCNALLSLKHHHSRVNLRTLFPRLPTSETETRVTSFGEDLPPNWTYGEQIFSKTPENLGAALRTPHTRDLYSAKAAKRTRPRTVAEVRESHNRRLVKTRCTLTLQHPHLLRSGAPEGIEIRGREVIFEIDIPMNNYLFDAAHRHAAELQREMEK